MERKILARNLTERMREKNLTNPQVAELSGTNAPMISNIRNARANPTLVTLSKIARAVGLTLGELLTLHTD